MYFLKRLLLVPPLLLLISFLAFVLVHLAPGGPFDRDRGPASPEIERAIRAKYHLDEPVLKQYARYLGLVWEKDPHGHWRHAPASFDISLKYRNHSVTAIIAQALPVSATLGFLAFGFALGVGLPVGYFTSVRRGRWEDYAGSLFALLVICVPALVVAPLLLMIFAIHWRLFPVALWGSPWHAVLPTTALGLYFSGRVARLLQEGMLAVMPSEFITAARAKGLGENAVLLKHAFRLAVLPVVSYSGPMLADLLTGSFIIESIFQIPGLGMQLINSSLNSDYTVTVALALLYALLLILLNLLVDFAYVLLDRRVAYQ
ncbi:Binding-protein-dependent transport systems inner membrane component [Verrucomicrobia bacterium]|nr:Binding-protein-dependent transport systems inner membrane component [Verrucomicrobiota bacterium]